MKKKIGGMVAAVAAMLMIFALAACTDGNEPPKLEAPSEIQVIEDKLSWKAVENAYSYQVDLDGTVETVPANYYFLPELTQTRMLSFRVKAVGNGTEYTDSPWAEYTYLYEQPTEALSFKMLEDGSGYEVRRKNNGDLNKGLEGRLVIPDYYNGLPVKRIGEFAFSVDSVSHDIETGTLCNTVTTELRLPAYLESVGKQAFGYCIALQKVDFSGSAGVFEDNAFIRCIKLQEVSFPEGTTEFGMNAFTNCNALNRVAFPSTLKKIGITAFSNCAIEEAILPEGLTELGRAAFENCTNLANVSLPASLQKMDPDVFNKTAWYEAQPNGLVTVRGDILYRYKGDMPENTNLTLPASVKYVAGGAFSMCANLKSVSLKGKSIIGHSLFSYCKALEEAELPSGLTEIELSMFLYCTALKTIEIPEGVTKIGESAFVYCTSLTEIKLPATLKTLEGGAFRGCAGLQKIEIPEGVTETGEYAFSDCSSLTEVKLPSTLKKLGGFSFGSCKSLQKIEIPEGVTEIGGSAFSNCSLLTEVKLPSTLKKLGENAFEKCTSLQQITLPESLQEIGKHAFMKCTSLKSIVIPGGVTEMGYSIFQQCASLESVVFSEGITQIASGMFYRCDSLKSVVIPKTMKREIGGSAFPKTLSAVYYTGTKEEGEKILSAIQSVPVYYYSESEPEKNDDGTAYNGAFWHYVDGEIVVWTLE